MGIPNEVYVFETITGDLGVDTWEGDSPIPAEPYINKEDAFNDFHDLFTEIDCRIEHGADSNGHLKYVHRRLKELLFNDVT